MPNNKSEATVQRLTGCDDVLQYIINCEKKEGKKNEQNQFH